MIMVGRACSIADNIHHTEGGEGTETKTPKLEVEPNQTGYHQARFGNDQGDSELPPTINGTGTSGIQTFDLLGVIDA